MKKLTQPAILVALGAMASFAAMVPDRPKMLFPVDQNHPVQADSTKKILSTLPNSRICPES